jgi:hypothetical protein
MFFLLATTYFSQSFNSNNFKSFLDKFSYTMIFSRSNNIIIRFLVGALTTLPQHNLLKIPNLFSAQDYQALKLYFVSQTYSCYCISNFSCNKFNTSSWRFMIKKYSRTSKNTITFSVIYRLYNVHIPLQLHMDFWDEIWLFLFGEFP